MSASPAASVEERMTDIAKLVERLEAATGPDRELDAAIVVALDLREDWLKSDRRALVSSACFKGCPTDRVGYVTAGKFGPGFHALRYTESIDVALTLVPDGYRWLVGNAWKDKHGSCPAMASVIVAGDYGGRPATGATPALALCIAALKARQALARKEQDQLT